LLAYELLGGPRGNLGARARYIPLAALSQEGNDVLKRGLIDEVPIASDLAHALDACLTDRFVDDLVCPVWTSSTHAQNPKPAPADTPLGIEKNS